MTVIGKKIMVGVYLAPKEFEIVRFAAKRMSLSQSSFIRVLAIEKAREIIAKYKRSEERND